jgi:predicted nucleic acid-binding protein
MLQVRVIGTVGLLALAKSEGLLDSVSRAIADLERVGFRLSDELRRAALVQAGEFKLD